MITITCIRCTAISKNIHQIKQFIRIRILFLRKFQIPFELRGSDIQYIPFHALLKVRQIIFYVSQIGYHESA